MSEGILQFSLGLTAGGFLDKIVECKGKLLEFAGAAFGADQLFEGFKNALERGDTLKHLSDQTGESVNSLYSLQEAFKTVGLSSEELPNMLIRMNQALSGLGRGSAAFPIFQRLGLDVANLKSQNAAGQISSISNALSHLDRQSAIGVSSQLFGMETGAKPFLQIVGSIHEFNDALADSKTQAAIFGNLAPIASKLDATFISIRAHIEASFASLATSLGPALQRAADYVNGLSTSMMHFAENASRGIVEAFKEAKVSELLNLSFAASAEYFTNLLGATLGSSDFWKGIWDVAWGSLLSGMSVAFEVLASLGEALMAALDTGFQKIFQEIGKTALGRTIGIGGYQASSFDENFQMEHHKGLEGMEVLKSWFPDGASSIKAGFGDISKSFQDGMGKAGGIEQDKLKKFWEGLTSHGSSSSSNSSDSHTTAPGQVAGQKYTYRPDFTSLEKMGFVGGGASLSQEYARRTADGVGQMVSLLQRTVNLMSGPDDATVNAI